LVILESSAKAGVPRETAASIARIDLII